MEITYLIVNIVGILVFAGIAFACSKKKKEIPWITVGVLFAINILLAWFLLSVPAGQAAVRAATDAFAAMVNAAMEGVTFAFSDSLISTSSFVQEGLQSAVFFASALLPIIVIVPFFDILTYIGVLPWIIRIIGKFFSIIARAPKFESFFSIEMMFLGNTEAIAASRFQVVKLTKERCLTIAMMSMSCVSAALIGAYTTMMPGQFIITAIPLNVINALIITSILNPCTVSKEEDEIPGLYEEGEKRESFFSFLGGSILTSGKLVLIICANVIAFVGLAAVINLLLGLFNPLIHMAIDWDLSLQSLLGLIMYIPACLLGLPIGSPETMQLAEAMGTKIVTNEFVVMGQFTPIIGDFSNHFQCVTTVFLTSFANFSTLGMIIGCFQGLVKDEENKHIAKNVGYMLLSGILVSLMSASMAGVFVW